MLLDLKNQIVGDSTINAVYMAAERKSGKPDLFLRWFRHNVVQLRRNREC